MKNLLKKFRADLSQIVLDTLWSAWSEVGVMGHGQSGTARIVDPEPLLLLTWECARQDSRVFDEVLDWLVRNGRWINVVRLTTLLKEDQTCPPSLAGAVAAFMTQHDKGPKWRTLAERCRPAAGQSVEPLFQRQGKPLVPLHEEVDELFASFGWARSPVFLRGQSQPMPAWRPTSLMLKCRALFGVNIRADVFAWLIAHGHGTASGLARELGYSQRRVQDTLLEMQMAELFQTHYDGNRREYSLDANKGWQLMFEAVPAHAAWFNWRAFARAVSVLWKKAHTMKEQGLTDYLFESEISKTLAEAQPDFADAGLHFSMRPTSSEFLQKLKRLTHPQTQASKGSVSPS
jgi:hypothetical protein